MLKEGKDVMVDMKLCEMMRLERRQEDIMKGERNKTARVRGSGDNVRYNVT